MSERNLTLKEIQIKMMDYFECNVGKIEKPLKDLIQDFILYKPSLKSEPKASLKKRGRPKKS